MVNLKEKMETYVQAVSLLLTAGCGSGYDLKTPLGIEVITNGYSPDVEMIDSKYRSAQSCLEKNGWK